MAKILSIFLATLAALSPVAAQVTVGVCKPGIIKCGSTLQRSHFPGAEKLQGDGLYLCDQKGSVEQLGSCEYECVDGGDDEYDFCLLVSAEPDTDLERLKAFS
ncbi:hypothetical protein E4U30_001019 [Claviceps sp. LM220 group G6]|nr:hypothetical protein E4U30_001019 [Claviceps sp. LM220 group G6]